MKKVYALAGMMILSLTMAFAACATETAGQGQQVNAPQAVQDGAGSAGGNDAAISGANDERLINPQMNYRERVEMQRAIQKRAAAKRNALLQAAGARSFEQGEGQGDLGQGAK